MDATIKFFSVFSKTGARIPRRYQVVEQKQNTFLTRQLRIHRNLPNGTRALCCTYARLGKTITKQIFFSL